MSDITDKVKEKFTITCNACGSNDVSIDFYAGFIHDSGGDCGYLSISCNACLDEVSSDDL
jgi:hypothetical protein